jgi:16S rRNA (cytidine1402-2'-O)-methyltransferase
MVEEGKLYVVGTPIGNLEDITLRAARVLREVDLVAAEDTRRSLQLLNHLGCPKTLVSYHEHNKRESGEQLIRQLGQGARVALVTDAGMPCISDPGWELVDQAREAGVAVEMVPGPTAVATAAAASGFDSAHFYFEGFVPRKGRERRERLDYVCGLCDMVILYEAPHRLEKLMRELAQRCPLRPAALCKDLTKRFEKVLRGTLEELCRQLAGQEILGEYVLVLGPYIPRQDPSREQLDPQRLLLAYKAAGDDKKEAIRQVTALSGLQKRQVYKLALEIWGDAEE